MGVEKIQIAKIQSNTYVTNRKEEHKQIVFNPQINFDLSVNVQPSIDCVQVIKYVLNRLKRIIDAFRRI